MSGALYVNGQWIAPNYSINKNYIIDCDIASAIDNIGLIIRSQTDTAAYVAVAVNGNAYVPPLSIAYIINQSGNCHTYSNGNYGPVSFATLYAAIYSLQNAIMRLPTTLQLDDQGNLNQLAGHANAFYDKFQFGPCLYQTCTPVNANDSNADVIFFNGDGWFGPNNDFYPDDTIIIFNVSKEKIKEFCCLQVCKGSYLERLLDLFEYRGN